MLIGTRKIYENGGNKTVFQMQIPKIICEDMGLTKDSLIRVEYENGKMIVTKAEDTEVAKDDN